MISYEKLLTYKQQTLTGRDLNRLVDFIKHEDLEKFGFRVDGVHKHIHAELTPENVKVRLELDLDFAFEKALDKRGISASEMYNVIKMWMFILEDDLQHFESYAQYGLPLFKAVALKFGFQNQIGDDDGDEEKYEG